MPTCWPLAFEYTDQSCHDANFVATGETSGAITDDMCRHSGASNDKVGIVTTLGFQFCWLPVSSKYAG